MEHDQATGLRAAERYLLGELLDAERDEFEEHFFDCPTCAEEVRAGAIFEANARAVFAGQARRWLGRSEEKIISSPFRLRMALRVSRKGLLSSVTEQAEKSDVLK